VIKSRRMGHVGAFGMCGERGGAYRVLVGKPEEKRQLGRPTYTWRDIIKTDVK
jgi:hypothetical protein